MSERNDRWEAASDYERYMGRWSRQLAPLFLTWLKIPRNVHWLDVGCGTGALTGAICAQAEPASVVGCDPVESFVAYAGQQLRDARASFVVAGTGSLPARTKGYGSVTSLLALNFFPDAQAGLNEMQSLAGKGAVVSACVWDYAGKMAFLQLFWKAAAAVDPNAGQHDEGNRFPICRPGVLVPLFQRAGLRDVICEPIEVQRTFAGFADYWDSFLGGTGPAPAYVASLEPETRSNLARALEQALPRQPKGAIVLHARAWAVRGIAGQ